MTDPNRIISVEAMEKTQEILEDMDINIMAGFENPVMGALISKIMNNQQRKIDGTFGQEDSNGN